MQKTKQTCRSKRLMAFLLALTVAVTCCLAGCGTNVDNNQSAMIGQSLTETQQQFEDFTDAIFRNQFSDSTAGLHFRVADPEAYGFDSDMAVTWGDLSETAIADSYKEIRSCQKQLKAFDYSALTEDQQLTYDILETYLSDSMKWKDYDLYQNILSSNQGVQAEIPLVLSEYEFYRKQDIEDYLELIEQLPSYFKQVLAFAKRQADAGLFQADFAIEDTIEQCKTQLADREAYYVTTAFEERIAAVDFLTDAEKESYCAANAKAMEASYFPAYQSLIAGLEKLKGTGKNEGGLANFKNGKAYYALLVRDATGSDKTVEELRIMLEEAMNESYQELTVLLTKEPTLLKTYTEAPLDVENPRAVLEKLKEQLNNDFPEIADVSYTVKSIPAAMSNGSTLAFYIVAPVDRPDQNIIYFDPLAVSGGASDIGTIAHEGLPGHMYQNTYFHGTNPSLIRDVLDFTGYTEGWAVYTERYGYQYSGLNENAAKLLMADEMYGFALSSIVDIGVNYEGWTRKETAEYLAQFAITDTETVNSIFDAVVEDPAVYLSYAVGYLEIMELREEAETALGDAFSAKEFHTFLLDMGPAPFEIIHDRMQDWIAAQKGGTTQDAA